VTKLEEKWEVTRRTVGSGKLSIVMPVYNLAAEVKENLLATAELFEKHAVSVELVPVDDGSADGSAAAIAELTDAMRAYPHVAFAPVLLERNGGKGAALRAGFEHSTGEYVMLLDGDLDIHPKQTPWFFDQMVAKNADIVIGSKRHRRSVVKYPWHRRIVSWCYFTLVRIFVGLPITDTQTGMKLFKREVLGEALARMLVKTYAFDLELLAIAHQRGAKIAEAPVVIKFAGKFGCLKPATVKTMAWDSLAVFYRLRVLRYYANAEAPKKLDHDPLVSIVIACPNRSAVLDECVKAIGEQSYRNFEVIVLPDAGENPYNRGENAAERNTVGRDVPIAPSGTVGRDVPIAPLRWIVTGKVRPAEKRNLGIREAKGEIIAFIDDDAYPDSHWLEYAIRYFGEESIGGVGGPGVTPPGDAYLAKLGGRVYDNPLVSGNYRYRYKAGGVRRDVDDYPSCNLFVRKNLLDEFGGYRTDFWPGEDTLLCKDIVDRGKRIVYDPWVVVYHHRRALLAAHLRQLGRYAFHRGYFVKRYPSNSLHLSYFVPSAFCLYSMAWLVSLLIPMPLWALAVLTAPMALYWLLVLATTFSFNPVDWAVTAVGVAATHLCYGWRFLQGLVAEKAPCEFIGKDHA